LGFSHQQTAYELSQLVPLAVIIAVGVIFYALGRPARRNVTTEAVYGLTDPPP
jgi:hypothetical protein